MDKLKALYLKYLQHNLPRMEKEHLVKFIAPLVVKAIDFTNEDQVEVVRESLAKDMARNPSLWEEGEKKAVLQGDEVPPALPVGESDEDMYAPMTMEQALEYLEALTPTDEVLVEDIANATSVLEQLAPFLFSTEMPEVGVVDEVLAVGWSKGGRGVVIIFNGGDVFLQPMPAKEAGQELVLDEHGVLKKEDVESILKEVHSVKY